MYIKVCDLCLKQNSVPIFSNLSFFVEKNESVRLVGKNAIETRCLLEILAGKRRQSSGTVSINDVDVLNFKGLAYLPSDSRLLAHHTVLENLAIPLLLLYSEKRGKLKTKYFFYIFYPAHLVLIYGIDVLISILGRGA